jgi:hypothetical protein
MNLTDTTFVTIALCADVATMECGKLLMYKEGCRLRPFILGEEGEVFLKTMRNLIKRRINERLEI